MKYLKIHKLIWFLLVVAATLIEGVFCIIVFIIWTLWNFKFPRNLWSNTHRADNPYDDHWGGAIYKDKNMFETIKRRYYNTF